MKITARLGKTILFEIFSELFAKDYVVHDFVRDLPVQDIGISIISQNC